MSHKNKILFFSVSFLIIGTVIGLGIITYSKPTESQTVLGQTFTIPPTESPNQTHFNTVLSPLGGTVAPTTQIRPSAPPADRFEISLVNGPTEAVVHSNLSFTWQISGPARTIHTTTIYWGTVSIPGTFSLSTEPGATKYTETVKDFMNGDFAVPLRYIGNSIAQTPGKYFYRAYALIDGKHYWSGEKSFIVKPEPRHEIKIVDRPGSLKSGDNAAFTWDVFGPAGTTSFTVIAGAKESKPGTLDESVDLPQTPYAVLVSEFTTGPYSVPLRFIGNTQMTDPGTYYYRALAFINGKNIWSDEYSFTVE